MAASLIVKAYLQRDDEGQSEIRRFPLRVELGQDRFKALQRRLVEVFPGLKMGRFTLHWKDEDGDLVKFCSQDELQQALNMVNDGVLRIYISADSTAEEAAVVGNAEGDGKEPPTRTFKCPLPQPSCGRIRMHPSWHMHGMHFKKMKKMAKKMAKNMRKLGKKMARIQHRELMILRSQVPPAFRSWVRKYIRVWITDGHLAAAKLDGIPEGAPPNFREWLVAYLEKISKKQEGQASGYTDTLEQDIDLPVSPEGLPASYYRWLCLYVERNFANYTQDSSDSDTSSSNDSFGPSVWQERGRGPCHWHMHHFRNGHCLMKGKHGWSAPKSADEEISKKQKQWKKIPPELRKYLRFLMKTLHREERKKHQEKKEMVPEGMSLEAVKFIQEFVTEWHSKLTSLPPHEVSIAMAKDECTGLPKGIENEYIPWLCQFLARWHRRHAGKCDMMAAWSSGDTSDTSEDEQQASADACYSMHWPLGKLQRKGKNQHFTDTHSFPPSFGHHGMHMPSFHGPQFGFPPPPPPPMVYPERVPTLPPMIYPNIAPPLHPPPSYWDQVLELDDGYHFHGGRGCWDQDQSQRSVSEVTEAMKKM
ncbi:uncharacterized protein LOC112559159 isoform X2 [Pomacea canaliculata]|uniref:uncharacterized protein LOC112559159 isoform X2 n=1 Tax=Pomacea canaliculata TaxID=400727 RepID=UPI000D72B498|nr:uncharacterized protein LOC112559159 isoform X2 [Pomacea canaliculata]